jgi:hypothetical protein
MLIRLLCKVYVLIDFAEFLLIGFDDLVDLRDSDDVYMLVLTVDSKVGSCVIKSTVG